MHPSSIRRTAKGQTLVSLLAIAGVGHAAACEATGTEAQIAGILAADSVRLADGGILRLSAIDIPDQPEEVAKGIGDAARGMLARLAGAPTIRFTVFGAADRYGRLHANVFADDGGLVQMALVASGLARVLIEGGNPCLEELLDLEAKARKARLGLWAEPQLSVRSADDPSLSERNGLYEIVEGRVLSIGRGSRMVFVDFGRDFRRDFTVLVRTELADRMAAAGLELDGLVGKRVRVRGVIEDAGGPAIRVSDPGEIEVLDENEAVEGLD